MKRIFATVAAGVAGPLLALAGPAAPAQADCFWYDDVWFGTNPANSNVGYAHSNCDGVWASGNSTLLGGAPSHAQNVRGWYYAGSWQVSSLGWQYVDADPYGPTDKIVGNTVDGRAVRAEAYTVGSYFTLVF